MNFAVRFGFRFSAIGSQIEMFAKFSIMAVSVPVLLTLLETIEGLLGA